MEEREGISNNGVLLKGLGPPDSYIVSPGTQNPSPFPGQSIASAAAETTTAPASVTMPEPNTGSEMKKRRGRPRKYCPDGTLAVTLSPMPISSSVPLTGEFPTRKRGRGRLLDFTKNSSEFELGRPSEGFGCLIGANFTPHVITVNAGEDITMKVMQFSQQGSRAICILAANGAVANVTLRQPMSSGGTLTYEGRFEILSLSGSFMPSQNGGTRSTSGGISVSLAGPDGRVFGGGLAGLFIAAGPVQVVVGSFIVGHEQEQKKHKKQRIEPSPSPTPTTVHTVSAEELKASYGGFKPIQTPTSFLQENPASSNANPGHDYYGNPTNDSDEEASASIGEESEEGNSQSDCELSG